MLRFQLDVTSRFLEQLKIEINELIYLAITWFPSSKSISTGLVGVLMGVFGAGAAALGGRPLEAERPFFGDALAILFTNCSETKKN